MPLISRKSLPQCYLQKVWLLLLGMVCLLLAGCQESPSDQSGDELSELSLMHETIQVVSDIPVDAQKALAEAYAQLEGVPLPSIDDESDDSMIYQERQSTVLASEINN